MRKKNCNQITEYIECEQTRPLNFVCALPVMLIIVMEKRKLL